MRRIKRSQKKSRKRKGNPQLSKHKILLTQTLRMPPNFVLTTQNFLVMNKATKHAIFYEELFEATANNKNRIYC